MVLFYELCLFYELLNIDKLLRKTCPVKGPPLHSDHILVDISCFSLFRFVIDWLILGIFSVENFVKKGNFGEIALSNSLNVNLSAYVLDISYVHLPMFQILRF